MATVWVDTGGVIQLGTSIDPDAYYAGTNSFDNSMSRSTQRSEKQAQEDAYPDEFVLSERFEFQVQRFTDSLDTLGGLDSVPASCYLTYISHDAVTRFQGNVKVSGGGHKSGRRGSAEEQSLTLVSTGEPDTCPPLTV